MSIFRIVIGILTTSILSTVSAENAYGDHGIVYTARAVKVDEEYQNIISVPSTPMDIDNTTDEYPGFNFGFVFRYPMSCDTDYHRNEVYVYDFFLKGLVLLENYNSSAIKEAMTISQQHYGISQEYAHIAVDWISHNVYWTDPLMNWIAMQPGGAINDNYMYKVIVKDNIKLPRALAVDPIAGYLFWSDISRKSVIERSSLTGDERSRTVLIYSQLIQPNAIVADPSQKRIYWVDLEYIDSATYDGTDRRHVVRDSYVTFWDMALFENVIITTDVYSFVVNGDTSYSRFYDRNTGQEITDKRISQSREILFGVCMYHADTQPLKPEQDRCKNAGCAEMCVNEPNKATCLCREGSMLDTDDKSCIENVGEHQRAIVINAGNGLCLIDIRALSDRHDYKPICFVNTTENDVITFFEINMATREAFFAIGSSIHRVYIDKGADSKLMESFVIAKLNQDITGMSFDYGSGIIYFTVGSSELWYIDTRTRTPKEFLTLRNVKTNSLTVVPSQRKAYWLVDMNVLQSVDLGTLSNETITNITFINNPLLGTTSVPKHVVHDTKRQIIFILIEGLNGHSALVGIDYSGNVTNYVETSTPIEEFTIYKEYIVLIYKQDDKTLLRSADLGGYIPGYPLNIKDEGTIDGVDDILGVKILDTIVQPAMIDPCSEGTSNGGCQHICLSDGETVTCKCKLGFTLHSDGKKCVSLPVYDDFILVTDTTYFEVLQIPLNNPNTVVGISTPATQRPDGVIYNHLTNEVIWTGTAAAQIWAVNLNGTRQRLVADVFGTMYGFADQLALDPSTGNIYYTGYNYNSDSLYNSFIAVLSRHGEITVLVWEGHRPRDIELDPAAGYMFWSDYSEEVPAIYRAGMDGSMKTAIHDTHLVWPNGIALDHTARRIYWTDGNLDNIYHSDYDGNDRQTFLELPKGSRLMDLEMLGNYLYYVAMDQQQISRVHKDDSSDVTLYGPVTGLGRMYGLDVYSSSIPSTTVNRNCSIYNGGCSHFCFPRPDGHSCGCSFYDELLLDGKNCDSVPLCSMKIPNGRVVEDMTCVGVRGNRCQYKCDVGYKPRENVPHITCVRPIVQNTSIVQHWDVQDPCEAIYCPVYIENGTVYNCTRRANDVCLYRCDAGFQPNKTVTHISCENDGTWNYTQTQETLCSVITTTMATESSSRKSSSGKDIGIGVGIGVAVLVLIAFIIVVIVLLIRSGKLSTPKGKTGGTSGTSFENPRYADNTVQLGESNSAFGYATLDEDKVAASATNTAYDNVQPKGR